jgi:hypothetical protein
MMSMMITFTEYDVPSNLNDVDRMVLLSSYSVLRTDYYVVFVRSRQVKESQAISLTTRDWNWSWKETIVGRFAWNPLGRSAGLGELP